MKKVFILPSHDGLIGTLAICVLAFFIAQGPSAGASQKKEARVTQVIQDVQLLASNAAARPAAVNDNVREGTAVRTGQSSRTELTFSDQTLTRLGANSVFSFNVGGGTFDLGHGSILMQVPPNGSSATVKTAAVTAAITGGTALFGTGPPTKFMVLEGVGTFYPAGHPEEAITLHGGEMVMLTPDGHIVGPTGFNVKTVLETSELIVDFPDLANLPLILAVIREQEALYSAIPTPTPRSSDDTIDQRTAAESEQSTGPTDKFGAPSIIGSPNPYVINSSTQIQTDPTITTNGVTDLGKIYRGSDTDGLFSAYAFGSTSSFDTASGIDHTINDSGAVFKFTSLQLTGDPTVSTTDGETSLALIGVNGVTSGGPGGTLTFAGIDGLLIATENGSINLGPEISFAGLHDLNVYARGPGSNLTLGSAISTSSRVHLFSEGNIQVNGNVSTTDFTAFSGGDFLQNGGVITATSLDIRSLSNITLDASKIPDGGGGPITLNAANTLTINNMTGGLFGHVSLSGSGVTINLNAAAASAMFDFSQSNSVIFTAGTGGINASSIDFFGQNLTLDSLGDISVRSATTPLDESENPILQGTITAAGSFGATGNVFTGTIHVGGDINIGGGLQAGSIVADTGTINVDDGIEAFGGSIMAGGDIITAAALQLGQNPPGTFGNITAGGNIDAEGGIFTPGNPVIVSAGGFIRTPGVITGTLQAGTDIFINNAGGDFSGIGVVVNHLIAGGALMLDNVPHITPNNGGSSNHDGETFDDFSMMVGSIVSTGASHAVLFSNGGDANPDFDDSNPGNGGNIAINITLAGLSIGDAQNLDSIAANGGAFNAGGPYNGGNGGRIDITAAGDVSISDGADAAGISATTGIVSDIFSEFGGQGGTVNITASGEITVDGTVQVSSDDAGQFAARPEGGETPGRESASGGTIHLQSNLTTGAGITIGADGQLLSLLGFDAPGGSGSITLSTMGADIVVNGTVRADFGTVTLDQDDPPGATPTITLDGGTVQSATFNINGSGDLTIGPNNATAINIFGGTWNVAHDITINAENTSFAYSFALNVMAGNAINFTGGNSDTAATLTLPLSGDTTFTAGTGGINAQFVNIHYAGAGLNLITSGSVTANSIAYTDFFTRGTLQAGGSITTAGDLFEGNITAGTSISVGGSIQANTVSAGTTLDVTYTLQASTVNAGGDVTAGQMTVQTFSAPNGTLTVQNRILPYVFSTDPSFPAQGAKAPHVITANTIASPNGIDFSGDQFGGIDGYTSGGILTINASQILINTDISSAIGDVNFNGADAGATDFSGNVFTTVGGDGGTFTANATGDITVDSAISATTGNNLSDPLNPSAEYHGAGGTVSLNSDNGTVSVNSTIQVSSDEPVPFSTATPRPYRKSASGGNIGLTSGKTSGVAINVGSSSQLLSLLNAAAPGPGGKITIVASASNNPGNSSQINIDNSDGLIAADGPGGTVDIEHHGDSGTININNANIRADVVKVGAFGANGTLNIGGGAITADSILKLYAPGSNGHLNFIANVTLSSGSAAILAANTISIQPTVIVHIVGTGGAANIYTNHPDYNFTPGSGYTGPAGNPSNGSFGDNGAHDPQPLSSPIPSF